MLNFLSAKELVLGNRSDGKDFRALFGLDNGNGNAIQGDPAELEGAVSDAMEAIYNAHLKLFPEYNGKKYRPDLGIPVAMLQGISTYRH